MTELEFLEIVSLYVETWYKPAHNRIKNWSDYDTESSFAGLKKRSGKALKDISLNDCLLIKWLAGGVGGGNCWSSNEHYEIPGEVEPHFTDLDIILEQVSPKITYLEYRKLLWGLTPSLIEYETFEVNEYYGNSTTYGYKKVVLRRLWERLNGLGVI